MCRHTNLYDKKKSFKWILAAALSGFLFGFDTVVISGANLPIKELWPVGPIFQGFFIMSMALWGTVIWVFISEIFPNRLRARGQSFGVGVHWIFAALITLIGPSVISLYQSNPWPIFSFFTFMMLLQFLFSIFIMPETKGKSLEEINVILNKN